ncbi:MAG: 39S ribosomal protein L45 [Deltaproteobacteria bacterium]|jgi:predicted lipid-binding transport protein (Tim44 family)|nr:39S ribosomal protein L45 [Deltaproteobacteria bacterium]
MKKLLLFFLFLPLAFASVHTLGPELPSAEAARLGGGRSFGGGPGFSRSLPAPQRNMQQNQLQGVNMGAAAARGGMAGGFLGPLLAGGLLSALIFGGAFSGVSPADLIFIVALIFLARRIFTRRPAPAGADGFMRREHTQTIGDPWARLRGAASPNHASPEDKGRDPLPDGFDSGKFLEGAKLMYARMQEAWDKRDMEDIAQFAEPEMLRQIEKQVREDPVQGRTDILTLSAELYAFREKEDEETALVYFDALLREYADKTPENAREVWSFIRRKDGGVWKLHGIQQVDG